MNLILLETSFRLLIFEAETLGVFVNIVPFFVAIL
jgi:hypothetical protein